MYQEVRKYIRYPLKNRHHVHYNLLMVAPYFPPNWAAGCFRTLRFARFLGEFGWNCVVLTPDESCHRKLSLDMIDNINPNTQVCRFSCGDAVEHLRIWSECSEKRFANLCRLPLRGSYSLLRRLSLPDKRIWSLSQVYKSCVKILRSRTIHAIWITGPPFSWFILAPILKKLFGLPIVLDLRDPWTCSIRRYQAKTPWAYRIERLIAKQIFRTVDRVILNTEGTFEEHIKKYPEFDASLWEVITNGFDPDEFKEVTPRRQKYKVLVHGGMTSSTRTSRFVLEAIGSLYRQGAISSTTFRFVSFGHGSPDEHLRIKRLGIDRLVEFRGNCLHSEVISAIKGADALLLLVAKGQEYSIPGKLYEYLCAGRPIIMVGSPNSDAARIIRQTGSGFLVDGEDVTTLANHFYDLVTDSLPMVKPDISIIKQYESRALSQKLACILSQLVDDV